MSSSNPLDSLPPELAQIIRLAITGFIQSQLPSIHIIIVASLWLGVSFCLFMALLYSSTPKSRRKPLFAFSVIAVGFGTVPSILFLKLLVDSFVKALSITETNEIKPYIFALSFFSYFSSICVDSILLFRLMAVFPPSRLSPRKLAMIFGPLLAMKLGRIATVIALVIKFIQKSQTVSNGDLINLYTAASELPEPRAAWVLQLVDNGICSFLFLYKLNQVQSFSARFGSNSSYLQLLRTLFLIAISNFVFPVIFAILQIIFISLKLSYESLASINISGTNIEIIGVLFATIWAGRVVEDLKYDEESTRGSSSRGGSSGRNQNTTRDISFATRQATFVSTMDSTGDQTDSRGYGLGHHTSTTGTTTTGTGTKSMMTGIYSSGSSGMEEEIGLRDMKKGVQVITID